MSECRTCDLLRRRDAGDAPLWDCIVRTPHWDVVHCNDTSLEGWIVLVVRRHVAAVAELTDDEAATLGPLVRDVSGVLHDVVGCEKTYVVQFAESREHRHVHVHVIPRDPDLPPEQRGPGIVQRLGVSDADRVPEDVMNALAQRMRQALGVTPA